MLKTPLIKAFAFDLDGTIYVGNKIVDGAVGLIQYIKEGGLKVFYFTNASTRTKFQILDKLEGMGLKSAVDEIYTSAYATAAYSARMLYSKVFCIGTEDLKKEFNALGMEITTDVSTAEALIIGLDPDFTYRKLAEIMPFRDKSCPIIACNRDSRFPVETGSYLPGCGPIVAAAEDALGRRVDRIIGKPDTFMIESLVHDWGLKNTEVVVVGDSCESDVEMARRYGCRSFLISQDINMIVDGTTVVRNIASVRCHIESLIPSSS